MWEMGAVSNLVLWVGPCSRVPLRQGFFILISFAEKIELFHACFESPFWLGPCDSYPLCSGRDFLLQLTDPIVLSCQEVVLYTIAVELDATWFLLSMGVWSSFSCQVSTVFFFLLIQYLVAHFVILCGFCAGGVDTGIF